MKEVEIRRSLSDQDLLLHHSTSSSCIKSWTLLVAYMIDYFVLVTVRANNNIIHMIYLKLFITIIHNLPMQLFDSLVYDLSV